MRKEGGKDHHRLEGAMSAVTAINGWLAYHFGSEHPTRALIHGLMAALMVLGGLLLWSVSRRS